MKQYLIKWDAGFGESTEVIDAENIDDANDVAYGYWREEAESQACYGAVLFTEEVADEYDLDWEA